MAGSTAASFGRGWPPTVEELAADVEAVAVEGQPPHPALHRPGLNVVSTLPVARSTLASLETERPPMYEKSPPT